MTASPRQYDVFREAGGTLVVVIQSDLLKAMRTRVVAPLLPADRAGSPLPPLTPQVLFGDAALVLMPQLLATLTLAELGPRLGSLGHLRDEITRALDALTSGL
jgi:toxin CcdB